MPRPQKLSPAEKKAVARIGASTERFLVKKHHAEFTAKHAVGKLMRAKKYRSTKHLVRKAR